MIKKKICLLGTSGVGKTSLVSRFVTSIFAEKYQTTVGVKIDKKPLTLEGQDIELVVWDLAGDDEFQRLNMSYLRGAAGYLLVADGTRRATVQAAVDIQSRVQEVVGVIPFVFALNKSDRKDAWEVDVATRAALESKGWRIAETSAKEDDGVNRLFEDLARAMLASKSVSPPPSL